MTGRSGIGFVYSFRCWNLRSGLTASQSTGVKVTALVLTSLAVVRRLESFFEACPT